MKAVSHIVRVCHVSPSSAFDFSITESEIKALARNRSFLLDANSAPGEDSLTRRSSMILARQPMALRPNIALEQGIKAALLSNLIGVASPHRTKAGDSAAFAEALPRAKNFRRRY
jgi:hypothetical protein